MNRLLLLFMAFLGGIFLAIQGGLNARVGVLLRNPLLASVVGFASSFLFAGLFAIVSIKQLPSVNQMKNVPFYLWFLGGLFSVLGLTLYYFTIPRIGVSTMISLGLCGQLLFAAVAAHFGLFHLPVEAFTLRRAAAVVAMMVGILLMNVK